MRINGIGLLLVALGAAAVNCSPAPEPLAAPNTITPAELAAGWTLLFDGRTLDGWEDPAKETPPGNSWTVEDGCIKAVSNPRLREDLFTNDTFGNFELSFEWKIAPRGNSGVKYRVQDRAVLVRGLTDPQAKRFEDTVDYELANRAGDRSRLGPDDSMEEYDIAYEYQIIDNEGHPDALRGPSRTTGALYGMVAPAEQTARPLGEFNQSRIVLKGNHVEHWLNGVKVVDTSLDAEPIRTGLAERWGTDSPVYRLMAEMPHKEGPIALQNHNDEAWFRSIKIRRLD